MHRKPGILRSVKLMTALCIAVIGCSSVADAADWSRFRGPNGSGISQDANVPVQWSDTKNVKWKTALPGPGFSSPIVVDGNVLVTCYSGYGIRRDDPGTIGDLTRHLVCLDQADGTVRWSKAVPAVQPEDPFKGFITEHGYASQTPVSDGKHVFVFFGKTGIVAFDLAGNQIWQTSVGTASGRTKWGSAASPILFENLIIVNASDESSSLVALDKATGKEVWRETGPLMAGNWTTPVLVDSGDKKELVISVTGEVWGLDPATGKRKWRATGFGERGYSTSPVAHDDIVYCTGGMLGGPSFAIRAGGSGDVTDSHVVWTGPSYEGIISPILHNGLLFGSTNRGIAFGVDMSTGKRIFQARLATGEAVTDSAGAPGRTGEMRSKGRPAAAGQRGAKERGGKKAAGKQRPRGGGGRSGGPGGGEYASPILVGGNIYLITRSGTTYILAPGKKFELIAKNLFASDSSGFCATPAVSNGQMFVRSNKYLYCVAND